MTRQTGKQETTNKPYKPSGEEQIVVLNMFEFNSACKRRLEDVIFDVFIHNRFAALRSSLPIRQGGEVGSGVFLKRSW